MFRYAPVENKRKRATQFVPLAKPTVLYKPSRTQLESSIKETKYGGTVFVDASAKRRSIKLLDDEEQPAQSNNADIVLISTARSSATATKRDEVEELRIRNAFGPCGKPTQRRTLSLYDDRKRFTPMIRTNNRTGVGDVGRNRRMLTASSPAVQVLSSTDSDSINGPHESKRQWHYEHRQRQHARVENDALLMDQRSQSTVGELLGVLLEGSLWLKHSPLVIQYWVTQLNGSFTLTQCVHQLLMNRAQLTYNQHQHLLIFEQAPLLCLPLELLEPYARLALQALITAFTVENSTQVLETPCEEAVPRDSFFTVRSLSSTGQCLTHYRGFRFNHVLEHMLSITRIALVRDISCEVLRMGFRVLASGAAMESISCALQQAFCQVRRTIQPLEERALRGATLDTYLERKELEELFRLQQREQLLLTLIGCTHCGVLHALVAQYVARGELAMQKMQAIPE